MAVRALKWELTCDICKTPHPATSEDESRLRDLAESQGWLFNCRRDGTPALKNGKDYCPQCVPVVVAAKPPSHRGALAKAVV